jgi:hypothetical protein
VLAVVEDHLEEVLERTQVRGRWRGACSATALLVGALGELPPKKNSTAGRSGGAVGAIKHLLRVRRRVG